MSEPTRRRTGRNLVNEVEGYLLWQARVTEAEQRAREFGRPMEWLTSAQRAEIEQQYVVDTLRRAHQDLERIATRCVSLRTEYENRYRGLRRRCVGLALAFCAGFTMVVALVLSL